MDVLFHAASAALLSHALGERRPKWLTASAFLGALPDLLWGGSKLLTSLHVIPAPLNYGIAHHLLGGVVVCLILCLINWRIAFGLPMHILVDLPMHKVSQLYVGLHVEGLNWWQGIGIPIAITLWAILLFLAWFELVHRRRVPGLGREFD